MLPATFILLTRQRPHSQGGHQRHHHHGGWQWHRNLRGDGARPSTPVCIPRAVNFDAFGNLYIADNGNSVIRKVDINGIITTVAGNGSKTYTGDGGTATNAGLDGPAASLLTHPATCILLTAPTIAFARYFSTPAIPPSRWPASERAMPAITRWS